MQPAATFPVRSGAIDLGTASVLGIEREGTRPAAVGGTVIRSVIPSKIPCLHESLSVYVPKWTAQMLADAINAGCPECTVADQQLGDHPMEAYFVCSSAADPNIIEMALRAFIVPCISQTKFLQLLYSYPRRSQYHYIGRYDWDNAPAGSEEIAQDFNAGQDGLDGTEIFIVNHGNVAATCEAVRSQTLRFAEEVAPPNRVWRLNDFDGVVIRADMEYRYGFLLFDNSGNFEVLVIYDDTSLDDLPAVDIRQASQLVQSPDYPEWRIYAARYAMTDADRSELPARMKELVLICAELVRKEAIESQVEADKEFLTALADHLEDQRQHDKFVSDKFVSDKFYKALDYLKRFFLGCLPRYDGPQNYLWWFFLLYDEAELELMYNPDSDETWIPSSGSSNNSEYSDSELELVAQSP